MRITQLHLKNIGVFEDEIIEFREKTNPDKAEIHIFTGENGTGKSTILYALACGNSLNRLQASSSSLAFLYKRMRNENENVSIEIFSDDTNKKNIFIYSNKQKDSLKSSSFKKTEGEMIFGISKECKIAFFSYSGYRDTGSYQIESIQEITENPFENALDFHKSVNPQRLIQWIANTKTKEALALAKADYAKAEKHRKALSRIEETISNIINQKIAFVLEDEPLNVVLKVADKVLDFDVLPDGLKSILSWLADLLMRMDRIPWATDVDVLDRNFILFLDEIEVHLHPAWQRKILPEIQKLFKNAQIFISTHSPFVVGSVDDAWVYRLKLDENGNSKVDEITESNSGLSYKAILREVFDVESNFSVEIEKELARFRMMKNQIIQNEKVDEQAFKNLVLELSNKGVEIEGIVRREIRQMEHILDKEFQFEL